MLRGLNSAPPPTSRATATRLVHPLVSGHQEAPKSHRVGIKTLSRRRKVLSLSLMLFPFLLHPFQHHQLLQPR